MYGPMDNLDYLKEWNVHIIQLPAVRFFVLFRREAIQQFMYEWAHDRFWV